MTVSNNPIDSGSISDKIRKGWRHTPNVLRALRLIWGAEHGLSLAWLTLLFLKGLLPAAYVYLSKVLVDSLVATMNAGLSMESVQPLILPVALIAAILVLNEVLQVCLDWVDTAHSEAIQDYITSLIHEKSAEVDLAFYESPEYFDHLQRAQANAGRRSLTLLESTGGVVQNVVTLVGVMAVLIPYGFWLPLMLLLAILPTVLTAFKFNYYYHQWWKKTTADRRWTQYFNMVLTHGSFATEVRVFDLADYFKKAYRSFRIRLRFEHLDLVKQQIFARLGASLFSLTIFGITVAWIAYRTLQGAFTLGDLALFYQAYTRGQNVLNALLSDLSQIYSNSLFLNDLFEFLELEPQVVDPAEPAEPPDLHEGICLRNVTFTYPGSDRAVLKDFNIIFPAGKITAMVGENGAGKSTLIKLLFRFYDPEAGEVEIDGVNIRQLPLKRLRRMISVMFQLPVTYSASAAQNIAIGDLSMEEDMQAVEDAARSAGAHRMIASLPKGYETLLGKLFDGGAELSVGEWQRVVLARAILRQAPVIILDEPTSFMDSWAEMDWMHHFRKMIHGKTGIIITHRFTTARHADIIYVMQKGKIVEQGSHEELIRGGGLYAKSWEAQMNGSSIPEEEFQDQTFTR